ncbi:uncharacterized protein EI90DRAFT_3049700 [Cantharellus anzutake]|uniref:uncharacterized protein n=1 Tax=Cantharellus anzutake TaxID=1750568 RepID=UPI001903B0E7|nr:uncharacterized protein EI90DRAFT_2692791 [Cantharellus anzutake]XP_038918158.1 uncharacterized protein EI90DRAFT_3049700 [Cantharellus anzutake]KAF8318938.1 hypothetical protein EI90DRAFT_2692791 [Cantharellus anzutake]KAF8334652.1 hypothetical protein EI90DRAFT_3049700 [Cantharellus anzutake]
MIPCDRVFDTLRHSPWYNLYRPEGVAPVTTTRYVYGNPLIARTMIEHNFVAGLHVPTNLILIGDEKQTFIVYDVPSSLIGVENPVITFESQPESGGLESLRAAAEVLDKKVEGLLKTVIQRADVLTKAKL